MAAVELIKLALINFSSHGSDGPINKIKNAEMRLVHTKPIRASSKKISLLVVGNYPKQERTKILQKTKRSICLLVYLFYNDKQSIFNPIHFS